MPRVFKLLFKNKIAHILRLNEQTCELYALFMVQNGKDIIQKCLRQTLSQKTVKAVFERSPQENGGVN